MSEQNERADFAAAVRAMSRDIAGRTQGSTYMGFEQAKPFVAHLPEFWREPARVMANCGYYGGADEWMRENTEK